MARLHKHTTIRHTSPSFYNITRQRDPRIHLQVTCSQFHGTNFHLVLVLFVKALNKTTVIISSSCNSSILYWHQSHLYHHVLLLFSYIIMFLFRIFSHLAIWLQVFLINSVSACKCTTLQVYNFTATLFRLKLSPNHFYSKYLTQTLSSHSLVIQPLLSLTCLDRLHS